MRGRGWATLLIATGMLAGGCTQSRVAPNADITVAGTLSRETGAPVAGARVALTKGPDVGEALFTFATLGTRCLVRENIPTACPGANVTSTDARGAFAYRLKGRDTQGTFGNASTLAVTTNLDRGAGETEGPTATIRFQVQTGSLQLPLRFWESTVALDGDARRAVARWEAPPPSLVPASASRVSIRQSLVFAGADGETVWMLAGQRSGAPFDARLLEDSTGTVAVEAYARAMKVTPAEGTEIDLVWSTGRWPYAGAAGAPLSRGKGCFAYDAHGAAVAQAGCRLTDGDYHTAFDPKTETCAASSGCAPARHDRAVVDLGSPAPVTLVALRGCSQTCDVETSTDARTWRFVGSGSAPDDSEGGDVAVELASPVNARYVRVTDSGSVDRLTEVSVWDTSVAASNRAGSLLVAPPATSSHGATSSKGLSRAAWLAIALLIVVALGFFVALTRAKRTAG